jgi:2-C-methyl-D-erythritol 4-phosphate cytidylyltransferase
MNIAIVVAAGKGTRLGGDRPKQFLELNGVPVIVRTLRQFERCREVDEIIVVLPADEVSAFQSLAKQLGVEKLSQVIAGGETRAQSVQRGLAVISAADLVAVHDGVRPFVTPAEIDRAMVAARSTGAAILVSPVADTIKQIKDDRVVRTLPRADLRKALTPQCFQFNILKRAYDQLAAIEAEGVEVTDDCLLVERLGIEIAAVEGSGRNIKITRAEDLVLGEALLNL